MGTLISIILEETDDNYSQSIDLPRVSETIGYDMEDTEYVLSLARRAMKEALAAEKIPLSDSEVSDAVDRIMRDANDRAEGEVDTFERHGIQDARFPPWGGLLVNSSELDEESDIFVDRVRICRLRS